MTGKAKKVGLDLTEGSVWHKLIIFAIPIVLTNVVQQLYSMVDLAVIGQYVGSEGSVGVATGGEIADWVTPIAMGVSTAGQIYIAQLIGARREDMVKKSIGTLLTLSFLLSFVMMAIAIIFCRPFLSLLNCPEEALSQAESYMIITAVGYPFIFGYNAVVGALRGMGESKHPLYFISVAAVINIFADILLVTVIPLEAAGTAIATVLSQLGSFAAAFRFMYKNKEKFDFEFKPSYFRMDGKIAGTLAKLAIPQIARSMFVRFSMSWVNANVNSYGLTVSATNSIGTKIQKFLEVFLQGIDTACAAMIGQNLGAKKYDRAKKTVWVALFYCMIIASVSAALSLLFPKQLMGLMTSDEAVKELGVRYFEIISIHYFMSAFTATFQAMVTGSGFVSLGFLIGFLDAIVCRIGISLIFLNVFHAGYESYWWGTAFSRLLPGIVCLIYFLSGRWKTRKLLSEE
jgi:putative MATE family efflux protein